MSIRSGSSSAENEYTLTFSYPEFSDPVTKRGGYSQIRECRYHILGKLEDIKQFIKQNSTRERPSYEYFVVIIRKKVDT